MNYDQRYVQIWIDGHLMLPSTESNREYRELFPEAAAAGRYHWDPNLNLHAKGFQIMYYDDTRDLINPSDQSGYYSGVQIDYLEIWNGLPEGVE